MTRWQSSLSGWNRAVFRPASLFGAALAVLLLLAPALLAGETPSDAGAENAEAQLQKVMSGSEQRKGLNTIVGAIQRGKSGLGAMVDYLDQMVLLIIGELPPPHWAEG